MVLISNSPKQFRLVDFNQITNVKRVVQP